MQQVRKGLEVGIKANLLKRIEEVEKTTLCSAVPFLVMITYDYDQMLWKVCEDYLIHDGFSKQKVFFLKHFNEYVAPSGFTGTVLIDDIDCPAELERQEEFNVTTVDRGRCDKR